MQKDAKVPDRKRTQQAIGKGTCRKQSATSSSSQPYSYICTVATLITIHGLDFTVTADALDADSL